MMMKIELLDKSEIKTLRRVARSARGKAGTPLDIAMLASNLLMVASLNDVDELAARAGATLTQLKRMPLRSISPCSAAHDDLLTVAEAIAL